MGIKKLEYGENKLVSVNDVVDKLNEVIDVVANCLQEDLKAKRELPDCFDVGVVCSDHNCVFFDNCRALFNKGLEDAEVKKRVVKDKVLSFSDIREKEFKTLIEKTKRETCRSVLDVFRFALANTPRPQMFAKMRECVEQLEEVYGI